MRMWIRLTVVTVLALTAGCGGAPDAARSAAEQAFVDCAAEHDVDVAHVEINGEDFAVDVGDDSAPEAVARVQRDCEPLALALLEADASEAGAAEGADVPQVPAGVADVAGYVDHLRGEGFSGALLVAQDGEVTTSEGLGLADRAYEAWNTPETAFDIGSIAKVFTAVTVLRLVDAGALSLEDTLGELLDDVPVDKRAITVRQLLDFSSGLHEYHDTDGDFEAVGRKEATDRILGQELLFEPGADTAYSNSSYTLAALVVEEVTGRPFTDVVTDAVAAAGLTHTGFYGSEVLQQVSVATGYEGREQGANNPAAWEPTWALLGAGGMVSTAPDLRRWWAHLDDPDLLSPASAGVLLDELLPVQEVGGMTLRGVGGTNDYGFDAAVLTVPAHDVVVVVLSNANPPDRTIATDAAFVLARLVVGGEHGG